MLESIVWLYLDCLVQNNKMATLLPLPTTLLPLPTGEDYIFLAYVWSSLSEFKYLIPAYSLPSLESGLWHNLFLFTQILSELFPALLGSFYKAVSLETIDLSFFFKL